MGKRVKLSSVTNASGSTCLEVCVAIWGWERSWQKQVPRTETQKVSVWSLLLHCSEKSSCTHTPLLPWNLPWWAEIIFNRVSEQSLQVVFVKYYSHSYAKLSIDGVCRQRFETQTKEFYQVCYLSQTFLREILPQIKETQEEAIYKDYKLAIYSWKQFLLSY